MDIVAGVSDMQQVLGRLPDALMGTEVLTVPRRHIPPIILRPLIQAAREHRRVEVDYVSLNQPDREGRIIVPHTLAWTRMRWHVRAWCEKNQEPEFTDSAHETKLQDDAYPFCLVMERGARSLWLNV